jgi:uncharacterized membrane protein
MYNSSNQSIKKIVYTSLAIAMVFITTYVIKLSLPTGGYINFGDIIIFSVAALIGKRTALLAGGIGSALSDLLGGFVVYAPATLIIKGLEGLICGLIIRKSINGKINFITLGIGAILGAAWMVFGYFVYECFLYGIHGAVLDVPGNITQGAISAIVVIPLVLALNNTRISFDIESK